MRMRKILLLIGDSRTYDRGLLRGIARYSHLHGEWIFVRKPPIYLIRKNNTKKLISRVDDVVDGIVATKEEITRDVINTEIPMMNVSATERSFGAPVVANDKITIGKNAAEYFMSRGFKNFAYCGYGLLEFSEARGESFTRFLQEKGYTVNIYSEYKKVIRGSDDFFNSLIKWLRSLPKPVALMVCNDDRGSEVLEACQLAELRVPEDIAVLGVDNDELICELVAPPLSSIPLNTEKAGYEIAESLDAMMKGEDLTSEVITVLAKQVVTRQSTDILAIEDEEVSSAIRFIRERARDSIQVSDVVDATMLSKRALQQRFKKALRRSISDEIRRIRMDLVAKMLVETNLTVSQISQKLGFVDFEHIGRYFKKHKGVSPTEYRKKHGSSNI